MDAKQRLIIRPYDAADWKMVQEVHDAARLTELAATIGPHAFRSLSETADEDGLFDGELWVAETSSAILGFVAVHEHEITWLYVHPSLHRRGIGRQLLEHAIARISGEAMAWVLAENEPALGLYFSAGFSIAETKAGHLAGSPEIPAVGHRLRRASAS